MEVTTINSTIVPVYYPDYYQIGIGLIVVSIILLIFSLIIFEFDSFVHSWIQWVIFALILLLIIDIGLISMYYSNNPVLVI